LDTDKNAAAILPKDVTLFVLESSHHVRNTIPLLRIKACGHYDTLPLSPLSIVVATDVQEMAPDRIGVPV